MQLPRLSIRSNGMKKTLLWREIAAALAIKLLLLYGLWYVFFSHPALHSMTEGMNPDQVAAVLVAPSATPNNNAESHQERIR
jgi:hypothetical protein